jgi:hypothetical protein
MSGWTDQQKLDVPMGNILPGIIGKARHRRGEIVQVLLPNVLPPVEDPPIMFLIGTQVHFWVNFRHSLDCEWSLDPCAHERKVTHHTQCT